MRVPSTRHRVSWILPGAADTDELTWSSVLGFTSSELFATAGMKDSIGGSSGTILRIRLDTLGPGTPPD